MKKMDCLVSTNILNKNIFVLGKMRGNAFPVFPVQLRRRHVKVYPAIPSPTTLRLPCGHPWTTLHDYLSQRLAIAIINPPIDNYRLCLSHSWIGEWKSWLIHVTTIVEFWKITSFHIIVD
ncbi:hypothetical protein DPSP01_004942 [Paraphaeosphaeria sporulosa]